MLQLLAAAMVWFFAARDGGALLSASATVSVVSLSVGAVFANIVSVVLLVAETVMMRR
jgi:hypothetical protein